MDCSTIFYVASFLIFLELLLNIFFDFPKKHSREVSEAIGFETYVLC